MTEIAGLTFEEMRRQMDQGFRDESDTESQTKDTMDNVVRANAEDEYKDQFEKDEDFREFMNKINSALNTKADNMYVSNIRRLMDEMGDTGNPSDSKFNFDQHPNVAKFLETNISSKADTLAEAYATSIQDGNFNIIENSQSFGSFIADKDFLNRVSSGLGDKIKSKAEDIVAERRAELQRERSKKRFS